jgi:hypothetical protein
VNSVQVSAPGWFAGLRKTKRMTYPVEPICAELFFASRPFSICSERGLSATPASKIPRSTLGSISTIVASVPQSGKKASSSSSPNAVSPSSLA